MSETDNANGSPDDGFSNNNGSATEAGASSDCHSLTIDPVKLNGASKEAAGAIKPRRADARQEVERP